METTKGTKEKHAKYSFLPAFLLLLLWRKFYSNNPLEVHSAVSYYIPLCAENSRAKGNRWLLDSIVGLSLKSENSKDDSLGLLVECDGVTCRGAREYLLDAIERGEEGASLKQSSNTHTLVSIFLRFWDCCLFDTGCSFEF